VIEVGAAFKPSPAPVRFVIPRNRDAERAIDRL
jgi:hypothetical protein